jgi:ferrous iron transport protein A
VQLSQLEVGQPGVVAGFAEQGMAYQARYLSLGLMPGAAVRVMRVAPLGCPLQIKVGSTLLSMRRVEANQILVEASR